jgi:hypothetical protein
MDAVVKYLEVLTGISLESLKKITVNVTIVGNAGVIRIK